MKIIQQSHTILTPLDGEQILRDLEACARVSYQSQPKSEDFESTKRFIRTTLDLGHESVIEHGGARVHFITDRGVTHELVRHRIAAFTQESTRYCNYSKDKFENSIAFVEPCEFDSDLAKKDWLYWCQLASPDCPLPAADMREGVHRRYGKLEGVAAYPQASDRSGRPSSDARADDFSAP